MFEIDDEVVVTLTIDVWLDAEVTKVSYTKAGRWYGVKLKNGIEIHGIEACHIEKK